MRWAKVESAVSQIELVGQVHKILQMTGIVH